MRLKLFQLIAGLCVGLACFLLFSSTHQTQDIQGKGFEDESIQEEMDAEFTSLQDLPREIETSSKSTLVSCARQNAKFVSRGNRIFQNVSKIALASYPRSGNSFLRLLLEKVTGIVTGSVYVV